MTTITKKKKKKQYDYDAVANELIEMKTEIELAGNQLQRIEEEYKNVKRKFYSRLYEEYLICPNFKLLCEKIKVDPGTARRWFTDELDKELKYPEVSEAKKEDWEQRKIESTMHSNEVLIPVEQDDGGIDFQEPGLEEEYEDQPELKVKIETDVDFARYQETYRRIRNIHQLSLVDFKVGKEYRKKLTGILKEAKGHIEELIELLEADET